MKKSILVSLVVLAGLVAASGVARGEERATGTTPADVQAVLEASFAAKGIAKLDRLQQSPMQKACSRAEMTHTPLAKAEADRITQAAAASIKPPADGQYLGDWKSGEKIAQTGRGLQFSDKAGASNGGNCYACHQMTKKEISFGNIGPSLLHYGKVRGVSKEIIQYTWNKIYNSHATNACSTMPRFGAAGILTERQMKDVMALLLDPASPVNSDDVN